MGKIQPGVQDAESQKAPVSRNGLRKRPQPARARGADTLARGSLWKRKMRGLATRRTARRGRRHSSGKPMRRG